MACYCLCFVAHGPIDEVPLNVTLDFSFHVFFLFVNALRILAVFNPMIFEFVIVPFISIFQTSK